MSWPLFIYLVYFVSAGSSINRPVYKIILTQKGFTQFLQYNVEIPPLREFTLCAWIRTSDDSNDQSIFTYVANGNNRIVRLWLDSGGQTMRVKIQNTLAVVPVQMSTGVWRHVCLSYQADHGAWALYLDSILQACQSSESLLGYVIPGGGSLIVGYGIANNGVSNGLEGEIFGVNMILSSTIERNHTIKYHPLYEQKPFRRNRIKEMRNMEYIVLNDLQTDKTNDEFETFYSISGNQSNYFNHNQTNHDKNEGMTNSQTESKFTNRQQLSHYQKDHQINNLVSHKNNNSPVRDRDVIDFMSVMQRTVEPAFFKVDHEGSSKTSIPHSFVFNYSNLLEFETPPPPLPDIKNYAHTFSNNIDVSVNNSPNKNKIPSPPTKLTVNKRDSSEIPDYEVPPPLNKDNKVYGQWTSSRFVGDLLNNLKKIDYHKKNRRIPATIPLMKVSDNLPYPSETKFSIVHRPKQYHRKNKVIDKQLNALKYPFHIKLHVHRKRDTHSQDYLNLKQLIRSNTIRSLEQPSPKNVEITNRGQSKQLLKAYVNKSSERNPAEQFKHMYKSENVIKQSSQEQWDDLDIQQKNNLLTVLPFLKSVEYFTEDTLSAESINGNQKPENVLQVDNKSLKLNPYNNNNTPQKFSVSPRNTKSGNLHIQGENRNRQFIGFENKHDSFNIIPQKQDSNILRGRELAKEVSTQSEYNKDTISILKYNHGYLPGHQQVMNSISNHKKPHESNIENVGFDRQIKLGNVLNEKLIIGKDERNSFFGGFDAIPDIERDMAGKVKQSAPIEGYLSPRICKNAGFVDRTLYIQPDGSIDLTHILSPLKSKNIGMELVVQNYKKCSLEESLFSESSLLLIHWSKTRVRLFGGARPELTKDLCGFF